MTLHQPASTAAGPTSQRICLAPNGLTARASGKAILVGEHAVVYGQPALALALPGVDLEITLSSLGSSARSGDPRVLTEEVCGESDVRAIWCANVDVCIEHAQVSRTTDVVGLDAPSRERIVRAFEKALCAVGILQSEHETLERFEPQAITVRSRIPLGAGMGGSAAMSTAFVRLALAACGMHWPVGRIAAAAGDIDALFHGRSSGLDAAAVSSDGIIAFTRGTAPEVVLPGAPFFLALVDCGERASTSDMVARVAGLRDAEPASTQATLEALGAITRSVRSALEEGALVRLGAHLDDAHEHLRRLGVSTLRMDALCAALRAEGALGAKLTGAGGGGLVLALFPSEMARRDATLTARLARHGELFTTHVG